jgi:hypothetical protein
MLSSCAAPATGQASAGASVAPESSKTTMPQTPVARPADASGKFVPIDKWRTTLVTARAMPSLGDVHGITDAFTFEGRIFAHATFTAEPGAQAGTPMFSVKWFNGDTLISVKNASYAVTSSPYYLAGSTSGSAIGVGTGRVEIHANGKLLASGSFQVRER